MRPIKFRAWNGQEMVECIDLAVKHLNDPAFTVMQFTGLLDKNGKEIWEGDIVEFQSIKGIVEFVDGAFEVMRDVVGITNPGTFREGEPLTNQYEVLGNIWESPELLK